MNRPYVIINCAMSADGKIATPWRAQLRLSSEEDMARVYRLRADCDAVLVGIGTVLADDPKLTVKEKHVPHPKQPLRVVLDSHCRTPEHALVLNNNAKTLLVTGNTCHYAFHKNHVETISFNLDDHHQLPLRKILDTLYTRGIRTLLVEGGGMIIWNFLQLQSYDELLIYIAPVIIGGAATPTVADGTGILSLNDLVSLQLTDSIRMGNGILLKYKKK
ncbi:MAG: 2,5-diamino-6-(ribosylamino)-4(3H)-pyrimidinone 5'-phosphate reductase [Candidatus Thermoplasmatota archaeon]|nr:2,5-diamino-6-(ribosylamino)-4(3H)-pyrimidinone 5'-phosphate reductase [Candidatus Thermoplasmatota archaeon]MBU1941923.1 2,5-diamino-6-(ribosylamino)-4(3H)-pyrimidinone 5'-phosphate reductase [Candidatus Thermoplasmatota archaeon]